MAGGNGCQAMGALPSSTRERCSADSRASAVDETRATRTSLLLLLRVAVTAALSSRYHCVRAVNLYPLIVQLAVRNAARLPPSEVVVVWSPRSLHATRTASWWRLLAAAGSNK